jgi:hypothetical protein
VIIDSNGGGVTAPRTPGPPIHERPAVTAPGWPVLGLAAAAVVAGVALIAVGAHGSARALIVPRAVLVLAAASVASGLTAVAKVNDAYGNPIEIAAVVVCTLYH